jgi:hypothetical protein
MAVKDVKNENTIVTLENLTNAVALVGVRIDVYDS